MSQSPVFIELEARAGIEPANRGFAIPGLTTWLPRRSEKAAHYIEVRCGIQENSELTARLVGNEILANELDGSNRLHDCKSEGRRRQNNDGDQFGRRVGRPRREYPVGRFGPAGQCH